MSRRSKRRSETETAGRESGAAGRGREVVGRRAASASSWGLGLQIGVLAAVFGLAVVVAELAGAANLGVALGIGQVAFAIAVMYLLLRR